MSVRVVARPHQGLQPVPAGSEPLYEHEETRALVALVKDAAELVRTRGEAAFTNFRLAGSRWRQQETYIFVIDREGRMLVHPDAGMEGKSQLNLKDINGRPIIRGLIGAATALPGKPEGWYHYQWPVPGGLLPRWKSSFVQLVAVPSGASYIVGSGMYNDRMERAFVVDMVTDAAGRIEKDGRAAFRLFHDSTGPFIAKDAYVFVMDENGVELVNPAFPSLEGRDLSDVRDTRGKLAIREMLDLARSSGSGWVDYMWPKPGEHLSAQKSAYIARARMGDRWVLVGCGVYLADAPRGVAAVRRTSARELMALVREAGTVLAARGEQAYPEFRTPGTRWFQGDTYFFVLTMDGTMAFHATEPVREGRNDSDLRDVVGRPFGRMIQDAGASPSGEGWIHYMYPEPGGIFPAWKSTFVKRVTFPSGTPHIVGCGVYNMQMDKAFIEDVVNRAAALVEQRGKDAFGVLRDKTGPFTFMDTYVFVLGVDGTELVNAALPGLEGKNLMPLRDLRGKAVAEEEISAAITQGSAWLQHYWFKPGSNTPARKQTYVRKVRSGADTYIVGSGVYLE